MLWREGLREVAGAQRAIGGFSAYNLETAQGIVAAGERCGLPVILQAGSSAFRHAGRRPLALLALELARSAATPVGVHLDHSRSLEEITACLQLGYSSVMVDGSHLAYGENVALTTEVVRRAHDLGVWVEAELVAIAGDEDVSTGAMATAMTDPAQARDFVEATGVDALAVAVGNVHGLTGVPPQLDLERLAALRRSTPVPLVLHGASGLGDEVVLACVGLGVAKVNVNAELRHAFLEALAAALPNAIATADLAAALAAGREAVAVAAARVAVLLAGAGQEAHRAGGAPVPSTRGSLT
jgi:ketose-bisphosphate aldolase